MVDARRKVQLADFGLANFADAAASCSTAQPGATRYMAPEIFDPKRFHILQRRHTPASDMYSFGQIAWQVVAVVTNNANVNLTPTLQIYTEKLPFPDLTNYQAMFAILDGQHSNRSLSDRDIPELLWSIMQACWQFTPFLRAPAVSVRNLLKDFDYCTHTDLLWCWSTGTHTSHILFANRCPTLTPMAKNVFIVVHRREYLKNEVEQKC